MHLICWSFSSCMFTSIASTVAVLSSFVIIWQIYGSQTKILELLCVVNPSLQCHAPKRRLWKAEPTFPSAFSKHFSREWEPDLGWIQRYQHQTIISQCTSHAVQITGDDSMMMCMSKSQEHSNDDDVSVVAVIYGPQTKIWEDGTKDEMRIFEVLFNGS